MAGEAALLERAIGYLLGVLRLITPEAMHRPTPCASWDLTGLLLHLGDSVSALRETVGAGLAADDRDDPVAALRDDVRGLLGTWSRLDSSSRAEVGGCPMPVPLVSAAGAIEIAVHGWDIARACATVQPIPGPLAEELLELAPLLITDADRPERFAPPAPAPPRAGPGDRLVAFLGRAV